MNMEASAADFERVLLPALEQTIVATVLVDENDRVLFFNPAAEKLWGYEREEVLGQKVELLVPRSLKPVHGDFTRRSREGGKPKIVGMSRDIPMERKDGRQLWASFSLSKIDVGGRIHYMAFARDVSEERAQREENRLLLLAVNHTDRAVCVLDHERRIVQVNRAFTQMFGYEAAEVLGQIPSAILIASGEDDAVLARWRRKAWRNETFQEDVAAVCKDGRKIWVGVAVNPVFEDDDGKRLRNLVVVLSDVTEERHIRDLERDVLEALASGTTFEALGNFLCQRIESIAPGVQVSLCRVAERRLRPWAAPSFHASYGPDWEGVEIGEGVAGCGTCAHRGEPVMVRDIDTDPLWAPYKHQMLPHGLRSCWTYPVKRRDGTVAGTFAFYFRQTEDANTYLERIAAASVHLSALAIEMEENRRALDRLVQYDVLTGLPNRNHLNRHIDELLADGTERAVAVLHLGLDRFNDINESLGHAAGDQALVEMANRLKWLLSDDQFLARTEGDSFVLVAPRCDARRAALVAESVLRVVSASIEVSGFSLDLTASIGISHYPEAGRDRDALLQNAKSAMGQAKDARGGDYRFFSQDMNRLVRDRLLLGTALRRAVTSGGLRLEYQPQVRPDDGQLYGVEALARWNDPEFGEVSPGRFISLAEEIGEIEAIGRWALDEACRQMAEWRAAGVNVPVVSVNLSPFNFLSEDLPAFVAELLRKHDLQGGCLTIEITESAAMALTPMMLGVLHGIRALGVGLSVDDFGTGFSSLSNLANLPVTEVKIDRSFIDKCLEESRLQSLVTAVIGIGHSLALTVVAEGVETELQRGLLNALHCPVAQGYLFSRPMAPQDVPGWLDQLAPGSSLSKLQ